MGRCHSHSCKCLPSASPDQILTWPLAVVSAGSLPSREVLADWGRVELTPGFLDPAEEVQHSAGEERSGFWIVRRQRAVGEVVLITGVEE